MIEQPVDRFDFIKRKILIRNAVLGIKILIYRSKYLIVYYSFNATRGFLFNFVVSSEHI